MSDQTPEHPEGIVQRAEDWLHGHRQQVTAGTKTAETIAADLQPLLAPHVATVFSHAARIFADPQLAPLRADILDLAFGALQIAAVSL